MPALGIDIYYSLPKFHKSIAFFKYWRAVFPYLVLPEVPSIKHPFLNTSNMQYFMLLASGG